ncbi:MAG TPA: TonB family protein [Terriglobales bacterium]|nr:TonB family protein [Terriglobales bacterium]
MWPHSLLFSSDEEASRALSHAFRDLEFEVETCPEIFSAVEKITGRSFDVVVSDWHEGLEAIFLLKTVRELKANHSAFTLAIADAEGAAAAREAGADLVLSRPLVPDEIKYALLSCDSFLLQMKSWLPRMSPSPANATATQAVAEPKSPAPDNQSSKNSSSANEDWENRAFASLPRLRAWPSPPPLRRVEAAPAVVAAESIFDDDLLYRSRVQTLFHSPEPSFSSSAILKKKKRSRALPGLAIAVAFLSVGYVFSEPLRGQGTTNSVVQICGRVLERTEGWLRRPNRDGTPAAAVQVAQHDGPRFARSGRAVSRVTITPVRDPFQKETSAESAPADHAENQAPSRQAAAEANAVRIPESLKMQVQSASMRSVAERITPSLLAALEPVSLSEDLSRRLLLQKVLPSYPEQAVKARLQGPVVLEAWIGRDGTIQDLKLVRGSLLLGQAAYRAVKQWRYQPYLVNGRAVEAETFVTVDFRLP